MGYLAHCLHPAQEKTYCHVQTGSLIRKQRIVQLLTPHSLVSFKFCLELVQSQSQSTY